MNGNVFTVEYYSLNMLNIDELFNSPCRYKEEIVRLRKIIHQFQIAAKLAAGDGVSPGTPPDATKLSAIRSRRR